MAELVITSRVSGKKPTVDKLIRQLRFARIIDFFWICNQRTPRIVKLLGDYKEEAEPALPELYKIASIKSDYMLRGKAIEAIGKIGCSESKDFLLNILINRTDQRDRHAAIKALQYFKKEELKEDITYFKELTLNKKENRSVRHEALEILAIILEEPNDFLMSFISPVKDDVLHLTAVEHLGRLRVEEAIPILREIILTLGKNYQVIDYLFAIAQIERDIFGYGITKLELFEEKGLLDPLFQQPKFRRLFYSIRSEQAEKYPFDFEAYIDLLIEKWENQTVEFKSSLYYCPFKKRRVNDLFYKFVQSVAAFANKNEGFIVTLEELIGEIQDELDQQPVKSIHDFTFSLGETPMYGDLKFI